MVKIDDPIRKKLYQDLVLASVKVAEYEIPEKGQGEAKFQKVSESIVKLLPFLHGQEDRIKELIESAVEAMNQELKGAVDILEQ